MYGICVLLGRECDFFASMPIGALILATDGYNGDVGVLRTAHTTERLMTRIIPV